MAVLLPELIRQLREKDRKIAEQESTSKVARKNLFGHKSPKGSRIKNIPAPPTPRTDAKEGFDGTPESLLGDFDVDTDIKTSGTDNVS